MLNGFSTSKLAEYIKLKIPWSKMSKEGTSIDLKGVYIIATPNLSKYNINCVFY
jgi:hypothetical protein